MSKKVTIYRSTGVAGEAAATVAVGEGLEYHGEWMAHGYVTVTVMSAVKVDFQNGDFVEFAGRKYYLWNAESVKKQARSGSYGEAFVYENMKLYDASVALEQVAMHDFVLGDNGLTYSSMGRFSFFGADVEDLADRIQANLEREVPAIGGDSFGFRIFTPDLNRCLQRLGVSSGNAEDTAAVTGEWNGYYKDGDTYAGETSKRDVAVTIQDETLWGALGHAYNDFGLTFYIDGENVVIGGKAVNVDGMFAYGRGNGLSAIERTSDDEQRIVTRLFAYGSSENLPTNYYGNLYKKPYADNLASEDFIPQGYYFVNTGLTWGSVASAFGLSTNIEEYAVITGTNSERTTGKQVTVSVDGGSTYSGTVCVYDSLNGPYLSVLTTVSLQIVHDSVMYFHSGVDIIKWPQSKIETAAGYPGGMAILNLMLPGFPEESLSDWVQRKSQLDPQNRPAWVARVGNYNFSTDPHSPWMESKAGRLAYGVREGDVYFDGSDDREEIKPTIENTILGIVGSVTGITDDGWVTKGGTFKMSANAGQTDENKVWKEIWDSRDGDDMTIVMKSGYHNGREFSVTKLEYVSGVPVLTVERKQDESGRWVPNNEQPIYGTGAQGTGANDFVAIGVDMPSEYIERAAEKLFAAALDELDRIDHARYTHLPHIDEIFMAREQDEAAESETVSLHDKLRPGMVLSWTDTDLGNVSSVIDSLSIKEDGNNGIPTYDVVMRDEKESTLSEKISTLVNKVETAGKTSGRSGDAASADTANKATRLTGDDEHTVWGRTYWQDGRPKDVAGSLTGVEDVTMSGNLSIGEGFGIGSDGDAVLNDVSAEDVSAAKATVSKTETIDGVEVTTTTEVAPEGVTTPEVQIGASYSEGFGGTGGIFKMIEGKSYLEADRLYVRMKAYFDTLEIRRYIHSGGNRVASAAGMKCSKVEWLDSSGNVLQQESENLNSVKKFRCYFNKTDGKRSITNDFALYDLAFCKESNVAVSQGAQQRYYWRVVVGKGDNATGHFIDLSNEDTISYSVSGSSVNVRAKDVGSDIPQAEDDIVQLGHLSAKNRQGAIIEAVSGVGYAPTYRIYQDMGVPVAPETSGDPYNPFVWPTPKVDMGYDLTTHRAYLNVSGDFHFGDSNSYVDFNSSTGALNIKAVIDASSPFGNTTIQNYIDGKSSVYTCESSDMDDIDYQEGDLWVLPVVTGGIAAGTVLVCTHDKGDNYTLQDWRAVEDVEFNAYVAQIAGGTIVSNNPTNSQQAANKFNAIKAALNNGTTTINGGLILTNLIALKNGTGGVTAGITGQQSGNNIAMWLGGPMADVENPVAGQQSFAKSLFRFDGSGYLAGGNISWEEDGDTTVKGTIKADNFFHSICFFLQGGTYINNERYYYTGVPRATDATEWEDWWMDNTGDEPPYPYSTYEVIISHFTAYSYYTSDEIRTLSDSGRLSVHDPEFVATTGIADVVMCMPGTGNWSDNPLDYVTLPNPQDFPGKIVEVSGFAYGNNSGSGQPTEKQFEVHCYGGSNGNELMVGLVYVYNGGIVSSQPTYKATISTGGVARFISVQLSSELWVWALLANQTGGDVYINGGGGGGSSLSSITLNGQSFTIENSSAWLVGFNFGHLASHPNSLSGYGINDAKFGTAGTDYVPITLGSTTKNVLTQHQSLQGYASETYVNLAVAGYLPLNGLTPMTGSLLLSAGVAIKANDVNADLLAYKGTAGDGATGAHWYVGTGAQGYLRSGGALIRRTGSNNYTIWDSGNDGSGSGLDADFLDGKHASDFVGISDFNYLSGSVDQLSSAVTGLDNTTVKRAGEQEITGSKTFKADQTFYGQYKAKFGTYSYIKETLGGVLEMTGGNGISLNDDTTVGGVLTVNGDGSSTFALDVAGTIRANTGIRIGVSLNDALMMDASSVVFGKAVTSGGNTSYITSTLATFGWDNSSVSAQYGYLDFNHRPKVGGVNVALTSDISGYVPINGDSTITGNTKIKSQLDIVDSNNTSKIALFGNSGQIHATNVFIGGTATGNLAATRTWVGQQGYQANVIEGVTAYGTACPITNKIADIPMASSDGTTFGVVAIGTGFTFDDNRLCVDTSTFATKSAWKVKDMQVADDSSFVLNGEDVIYAAELASNGTLTLKRTKLYINVPEYTSDLVNDSGFITQTTADGRYATRSQILDVQETMVTALGVSGNNLTWTAGGQTNNVTVPFATDSKTLRNFFDSRPASANNQYGDGKLRHYMATSSMTTGKPSVDAHIIHSAWDNTGGYDAQLAIGNSNTGLFYRTQSQGTWQAWKHVAIIDNLNTLGDNLQSYVTTQLGGYLPLTAGSSKPLTGNIAYKGTKATYDMITFIDNVGDTYGNGIAIGGGGATIIGGGESAGTMSAQVSGGSEVMYIGNDQGVSIFTNLQSGWANRKEFTLDTNGDFSLLSGAAGGKMRLNPDGGIRMTVGTSYWANGMYAMSQTDDTLGVVGFFGNGDTLTYMYIGAAYNNTWMVVKPDGNVGIGTTQPDRKLHVNGDFGVGNVYAGSYLFMNANNAGIYMNSTGIAWHNSSNQWTADLITFTSGGNVGIGISPTQKLDINGNLRMRGSILGAGGYIDLQNNDEINRYGGTLFLQHRGGSGLTGSGTGSGDTGDIRMCSYGGNVGIGLNNSPSYKLDVNGSFRCTQNAYFEQNSVIYFKNGSESSKVALSINSNALYLGYGFLGNNHSTSVYGKTIYLHSGSASGDDTMCLDSSKNVGIGTATPSEKLSVSGNIESFATNVGTTITPTGIDVTIGGFAAALIEYDTGDADYAIARFGLRPQVKDGSDWLDVVVAKSDENGIEFRGSEDGTYTFGNGNVRGDIYAKDADFSGNLTAGNRPVGANQKLYVGGSAVITGNVGIGTSPTNTYAVDVDGTVRATSFVNGSDARMKDIVEFIEPSVMDVAHAPIITYRWKGGDGHENVGSLAQYWQTVLPQAVHEGGDGMLSMEYGTIALASAVTTARHSINNERRIAELELRVAELEDLLAAQNNGNE